MGLRVCVYVYREGGILSRGPAHARKLVQSNRDKNRLCSKAFGIDTNDEKDELDPTPECNYTQSDFSE